MHVVQRGVDRSPTFLTPEDYAFYLWVLGQASTRAGCSIHTYVLMTNHVHLLLTPKDVTAPGRMMQSVGRRYVRYFNDRYRRTGTLWEGRYRSAIVDSTVYLFECARYIELNPVRAGMVPLPAESEWSSHRCNARGARHPLVTPHPEYVALGTDATSRTEAYEALFNFELGPETLAALRAAPRGQARLHPTPYREAVNALYDGRGES